MLASTCATLVDLFHSAASSMFDLALDRVKVVTGVLCDNFMH
jgi:hypothetical protein